MFDKNKFEQEVLYAEKREKDVLAMEIDNVIAYLQEAKNRLCGNNYPDIMPMEQAGMKMPELMKRAAEIKTRHTYRVCIMQGDFDS